MMALHVGLRRKTALAGIVGYSGLVVLEHGKGPDSLQSEARARPPILLTHGDRDEVLPVEMFFYSKEVLASAEIPCQWHLSLGIGHGIDQETLRQGGLFLTQIFGLPYPTGLAVSDLAAFKAACLSSGPSPTCTAAAARRHELRLEHGDVAADDHRKPCASSPLARGGKDADDLAGGFRRADRMIECGFDGFGACRVEFAALRKPDGEVARADEDPVDTRNGQNIVDDRQRLARLDHGEGDREAVCRPEIIARFETGRPRGRRADPSCVARRAGYFMKSANCRASSTVLIIGAITPLAPASSSAGRGREFADRNADQCRFAGRGDQRDRLHGAREIDRTVLHVQHHGVEGFAGKERCGRRVRKPAPRRERRRRRNSGSGLSGNWASGLSRFVADSARMGWRLSARLEYPRRPAACAG